MNTATAPAGWHPDPRQPTAILRWWDGAHWTEHTQPTGSMQAPAATATAVVAAPAQPIRAQAPAQPVQTHAPAQPAQAQRYAATGAQPLTVEAALAMDQSQRSLMEQNSATFLALAVIVGYLVLAATTGIVLIGIFPALLAYRALKSGEKLAPLAIAAAAIAIVLAFSGMTSS